MKRGLAHMAVSAALVSALLAGCSWAGKEAGGQDGGRQTVPLTIWGAENDQEILREFADSFAQHYAEYADFEIQIGVESESTAKDTVLTDVEAAADVYSFASDQLADLVNAGALQSLDKMDEVFQKYVGKSVEDLKTSNTEVSVESATMNGTLYAFPRTADNGYFLYYDSNVISEEEAKSWDSLLDAAQRAGKKVGMTLASGWYDASFFYSAGFTTSLNRTGAPPMDWNGTADYSGVEVTEAMARIAAGSGVHGGGGRRHGQPAGFRPAVRGGVRRVGCSRGADGVWRRVLGSDSSQLHRGRGAGAAACGGRL